MHRVLIANRGEIAVRLARAARALGISPVGIASEADAHAVHRGAMDDSLVIGPASAAQSYLHIERILAAAETMRADAIHPGYGFLSERADFATAVTDTNLIFIGPQAETLRDAGDKGIARITARKAGLAVLDGYDDGDQSDNALAAAAERIGYPVLLKASNGGGGRGQRMVAQAMDFAEALAAARREARAAFGDDRMVIERYIVNPRHIEFQILADHHGNVVHFGERDCSLQRRRQKVMEEAPAPGMSPDLRSRMGEAALTIARAVRYRNAGTVEFLLDAHDNFYFLEINARLQVEHPVTEAVMDVDLAQWQYRIARGETLPAAFAKVTPQGWAVEARICAEDPAHDLLPSSGRITKLSWPAGDDIRIDAGFIAGDTVPLDYDSLLAKLIVSAPTRAEAITRLHEALQTTHIEGVATNIPLLSALLQEPTFVNGTYTTGCIEQSGIVAKLQAGGAVTAYSTHALAAILVGADYFFGAWRVGEVERPVFARVDGTLIAYTASQLADAPAPSAAMLGTVRNYRFRRSTALENAAVSASNVRSTAQQLPDVLDCTVEISAKTTAADETNASLRAAIIINNDRRSAHFTTDFEDTQIAFSVTVDSRSIRVTSWSGLHVHLAARAARSGNAHAQTEIAAPMPGRLLRILAQPGDVVADKALLAILEAMKMEHRIESAGSGKIKRVLANEGDVVAAGALLFELE